MTVAKVYRKVSISEQPKDSVYWQTRSYEDRLSALEEILDENKKTIIHIPSVNAAESSKPQFDY